MLPAPVMPQGAHQHGGWSWERPPLVLGVGRSALPGKEKGGGGPWWHCQSGGQTHGERAMQREYDGERGVSSQALKIKPVSSNQLSCSWSVCGNFPDVWVHSGVKATSVAWEEQGWHDSGTPAQPRGLRTSSWLCWKHKMSP